MNKIEPIIKPYIYKLEDGSTTIEWVGTDARFAICIEPDGNHSWHFVAKPSTEHIAECGELPAEVIVLLRKL